jgi:hypothetical protein
MKTFNYIINIIAIVLVIDFVCAVGWAMSGQTPTGNLYFGAITTNLLRLI